MQSSSSKKVLKALMLAMLMSGAYGCGDSPPSLRIETEASPLLLVHRNAGEASWTQVAVAGKTAFELDVDDQHEVVIVCEQMGLRHQITTTHYARTTDDGDELLGLCVQRPFVVSGTLAQPGQVVFDGSLSASTRADRQFQFAARRGTFDLLLFGGDNLSAETIGARRGLMVAGDLNLGTIDLTQEDMQPLATKMFEISNLRAEESPSAEPRIINGEVESFFLGARGDLLVRLPPATALSDSERLIVALSASTPLSANRPLSISRGINVSADQAGAVALPEAIGAPAFDHQATRSVATWSTLPEYDELRFLRVASAAPQLRKLQELRMSHAFATLAKPTQLELNFQGIPGFLPEWDLAADARPLFSFATTEGPPLQEGSTYSTAVRAVITADPALQSEISEDFFTDGYTWSD